MNNPTSNFKTVATWLADICRTPNGARDRQLVFGDQVEVLEETTRWSYCRSTKDGYLGYIATDCMGANVAPTHYVSAIATHAYKQPNMKSGDHQSFPFGARLGVSGQESGFYKTDFGFVPIQHLRTVDKYFDDPSQVAKKFLGTPYLWGGNSPAGIDCSGLVQAALLACGKQCPGDSGQQQEFFQTPAKSRGSNQLYFWKGHVALGLNDTTLIHANANTMSVAFEPIDDAISRIKKAGDGPVTHHAQL